MRDGRNKGLAHVARVLLEANRRGRAALSSRDIEEARDAIAKGTSGRARTAADILVALGDPDCPPETYPSPQLFREARWALGLTQKRLSWALGSSSRTGHLAARIERGKCQPNRAQRLLLRVLLRKLEVKQNDRKIF